MLKTTTLLQYLFLVSACASATQSLSMDLLRPYDTLLRPEFRLDSTRFHVDFFAEHGFNAQGFNGCGERVNIMKIWNNDQDTLQMINGFNADCPIGQLATNLRGDNAADDGTRGHVDFCGQLDFNSYAVSARYHFFHEWFITAYLPFFSMRLKNVTFTDLTKNITAGDISVKQKLTNNLAQNVCNLGGLDIGPWHRTGLGDLTVLLEWMNDFRQPKPMLKNVRVNWRLGLIIPSGLRQDENKLLAFPFGTDGAFGLIYGLGLDLTLGCYFKVGGDVQLTQVFGNYRCRRYRTWEDQTDLLLLQKSNVYRDNGLIQRFNIYAQIFNLKGFALKAGYQFYKNGDDFYSLKTQAFADNLANRSEFLQERFLQQVMLIARYDFATHMQQDCVVKPYVSIYGRMPVMGKRYVASPAVGGVIAFDF